MTPHSKHALSTLLLLASTGSSAAYAQDRGRALDAPLSAPTEAFIVEPAETETPSVAGRRTIVASALGDFSVFEETVAVNPQGTPLHRHDVYDEGFLVLDGQIDFVAGEKTLRSGPGSFVFVPRGVAHRFWNPGPGPARMWVIGSSGMQAMVEEIAPMLRQNSPNMADVIAAFAKHKSALLITPATPNTPTNSER
jgi:mannose-6-phosphate isomerase-like protein (cupin superfamily)